MNDTDALKDAHVLIVDDAAANLDLLRDILEPSGCHIYFATTGEMALQVAPHSKPDIILLDVMMPGIDGFETCRRLKAEAGLADTPVVFVTAKTDVMDLALGFAAGGVDYITKPVKPLEVNARVSTHLKMRRLIEDQRKHLAALEDAKKELQETYTYSPYKGPFRGLVRVSLGRRTTLDAVSGWIRVS
jgi:DNA-binding response OmpR family regulator